MDIYENDIDDNLPLNWLKNQTPLVRTHPYPFSWGYLHESITAELGPWRVDYEFTVPNVYLAFPSRFHLVDLFSSMYHWHPLRHQTFVPSLDGIIFHMSVMSFGAKGAREISCLRAWLVEVFIPLIWPDLMREAMKIITAIRANPANPQSLEKLVASWRSYMCDDPKSLSFYKESEK